ncbi:glycosyltransferase family 4 protein [bacterium]|nr:glycosyltransferase family 4 protein [bacterium]
MKVLFINEYMGFVGGVEQYIFDTVLGLIKQNIVCSLAYEKVSDNDLFIYQNLFENTYNVQSFSDLKQVDFAYYDLIYFHKVTNLDLWKDVIALNPSIIMVHDYDFVCPRKHKYFLWGHQICKRPASYLCVLDGGFFQRDAKTKKIGIKSPLTFFKNLDILKTFRNVIVASTYMKEQLLINGLLDENIQILPPCVKDYGNTIESIVIKPRSLLYVGQLIYGKGVDLLIEAMHKMDDNIILNIVGTGNATQSLKELVVHYGLENRVQFHGYQSGEALDLMYSQSQLLVVPSRWAEPFGMVGIEAMAFKKAIIAFSVGGIKDWLKNGVNGYLCEKICSSQLANTIEYALSDLSLLKKMGENGFEMHLGIFASSTYFKRLTRYFSFVGSLREDMILKLKKIGV